MDRMRFNVSVGQRFLLLICVTALCFVVGSILVGLLTYSGITVAKMRMATIFQDILIFIAPAVIFSIIVTRRPAQFMQIDRIPKMSAILLVICSLIASAPAMNVIIAWNENLSLPESMAGIEAWMRASESAAGEMVKMLFGGSTVGALIMAILIGGVAAGFSEELFFRGMVQRTLITTPVNPHLAIWITAILFSAVHMQFFGFVPRMLLGAYFGYLVWWSGSLWVGVAAHITNNVLAAVSMWVAERSNVDLNKIGTDSMSGGWLYALVSLCVVSVLIYVVMRECKKGRTEECQLSDR